MKSFRSSFAAIAVTLLIVPGLQAQTNTTATTDPVGFVTVNVTAGDGTTKKNTLFSLPLLEVDSSLAGQSAGIITGVSSNTISNSNAGWTAGALSAAATPYLIQITSGSAKGRMFLISSATANTSTTVTVSATDASVDLTALGIVIGTDTYRIFSCDTLGSFFGTPASSGILGGANIKAADSVAVVLNGVSSTYYYNTSLNRWTKSAFGNPDATNTPLLPYYGIQYQRLGNTPLSFVITGAVPTIDRKVAVKNNGVTILSQYWPVESTLSALGLQNMSGWKSAAAAKDADTVTLISSGTSSIYWFNGTNWKKNAFGSPISDGVVIPVGTSIQISRKSGDTTGSTMLTQLVPYSL